MKTRKNIDVIKKIRTRREQKGFYPTHAISLLTLLFMLGVISLPGCSQKEVRYNDLNLIQVSGKVLLENKPLANAQILFYDEANCYSFGVTDKNGKYRLKFNSKVDGTESGKKRVEIWTTRKGPDFDLIMTTSYPQKEIIPAKYNQKTILCADVTQDNHSIDFQLDKQGIKTAYSDPDELPESLKY